MDKMAKYLGMVLLVGLTACTLKYEVLKGTTLPNPPSAPIKIFIKESLKQLMGQDYPGDLVILNVLINVFEDDELCVNRLIMEIKIHQQGGEGQTYDYKNL